MARCDQQCFLSPRFCLQLLVLVFTMGLVVTERVVPMSLRGEVGGNVTFKSPTVKQGKTKYMYLQKGSVYINGYHSTWNITQPVWQNTRVDSSTNEVHMFGLNMSHSGVYDLYIHYSNDPEPTRIIIRLNVTGKYTTPSVTPVCSDENNFKRCIVTCASHGGFPLSSMTWNVFGTENTSNNNWQVLNRTELQSKATKLFTSSSTAYFNCSRGELKFSCSVSGVTSDEHSVCAHQDSLNNPSLIVIITACLVPFLLVILGLCWWRCKKRPIRTVVAQNVVEELKLNGCEEQEAV
ncbi:uncharacterized protein LOC111572667 [Amphiprion ocellaris]|uniref:CD80-like immunoglobulin C2-set domain-containing protein n=1 Tax=Amphiprion ocellaris TaxID=80972 RepID=A0AAQ5Y3U8_AMPOC|nr:uncharacterized protein LOC111572667 [Amphiprion ocellaris]